MYRPNAKPITEQTQAVYFPRYAADASAPRATDGGFEARVRRQPLVGQTRPAGETHVSRLSTRQ